MAGAVNLQFKFSSSRGLPMATGASVMLLNQIYNNPFTAISTSVAYSGTADFSGGILFSGINAGTYDVRVIGSGVNSLFRNYIVKNEFPVAIGESNLCFAGSNYIGSVESGLNILTQNKTTNARTIRNELNSVTGNYVTAGTGTITYPVYPVSGVATYTASVPYGKQSGNSYYHNTDAIPFTQRARFTVSI